MKVVRAFIKFLEKKKIFIARTPYKYYDYFIEAVEMNLLNTSTGVIHIGAHLGQESDKYRRFNLKVIWVEGNPKIIDRLSSNVLKFNNQKIICALLGDRDEEDVLFFESSNDSQSSSIFQPGSKLVNIVDYSEKSLQKMVRLDSILSLGEISGYDHWVLDVQGAELLVLIGADRLIENCKSLVIEVSRGDFYKGGSKFDQLFKFLMDKGFTPILYPEDGFHGNAIFVKN
jgi:FkbM family methyltransferase